MEPARYLDAIRTDAAALGAAAALGLDAAVPSCPGWTVADLVAHTGVVHREKERIVRERIEDRPPAPAAAPDAGLVSWFEEGASRLVATLGEADPTTPVWTWFPADRSVGFWYRRMAHETAIHRVDAELAHGRPAPVDPELAVDGVDEILAVMIDGAPPWATIDRGRGALAVVTTDVPARWTLREITWSGTSAGGAGYTAEPSFELTEAVEPGTRLTGGASDVLLYLWGRGPLDRLSVEGDVELVHRLRRVAADVTG